MATATPPPAQTPPLLTIGEIARSLNVPLSRVKHAVEVYRIECVQRAGIIRLFSQQQVQTIAWALKRTAERHNG